jgi:biotin operon repressor
MDTEGSQPQTAAQWVYKNDKTHKGSERQVLLALAACMDEGNNCPSFSDLAEMTQLSRGAVQHALRELEKDGTITSMKNGGKKKQGGTTNCYFLGGFPQPPKEESGSQETVPLKSVVSETVPVESVVSTDPLKHEGDTPSQHAEPEISTTEYAGAGAEIVSLNKKIKTTTTTVVVVPDDEIPPNDDNRPLVEQSGEMGDVARAFEKYIREPLTSRRAETFDVLVEDYGGTKIVDAFKAALGKNDPWGYAMWWLKNPQLVDKPKTPAPKPKPVEVLTEAERQELRRGMNHDVPDFAMKGATP